MWIFGKHRHLKPDLLSQFLDGQLSRSQQNRVNGAVRSCAACAEELEGLRSTVSLLQNLPDLTPSRSFVMAAPPPLLVPVRPALPLRLPNWAYAGAASLAALALMLTVAVDVTGFPYAAQPASPEAVSTAELQQSQPVDPTSASQRAAAPPDNSADDSANRAGLTAPAETDALPPESMAMESASAADAEGLEGPEGPEGSPGEPQSETSMFAIPEDDGDATAGGAVTAAPEAADPPSESARTTKMTGESAAGSEEEEGEEFSRLNLDHPETISEQQIATVNMLLRLIEALLVAVFLALVSVPAFRWLQDRDSDGP